MRRHWNNNNNNNDIWKNKIKFKKKASFKKIKINNNKTIFSPFHLNNKHEQKLWSYNEAFGNVSVNELDFHIFSPVYPDDMPASYLISCYYIEIAVGVPGQKLKALVDTGSANLAFAGPNCCREVQNKYDPGKSKTVKKLNETMKVSYAVGQFSAEIAEDIVGLANTKLKANMSFGIITSEHNFFKSGHLFDGIVGLAYNSLSRSNIVPFFDELVFQSNISDVFALSLCQENGRIDFGGFDASLYSGAIVWTSIIKQMYYQITMLSLTVGDYPVDANFRIMKTIVDSGTTELKLPREVLTSVHNLIRRQTNYPNHAFEGTCQDVSFINKFNWPEITFSFPSIENSNKQIVIKVNSNHYWRRINSKVSCFGIGLSSDHTVILGDVFMQGLYIAHDRANARLGFAQGKNCDSGLKPFETDYQIRLPDLCENNNFGNNLCSSTCEMCNSMTSVWCSSGTAFFTSTNALQNKSYRLNLGVVGGFCWHGYLFFMIKKTVDKIRLPNGLVGEVHVECNESIPYYKQCAMNPKIFLALWVFIVLCGLVSVPLYVKIAIFCYKKRKRKLQRRKKYEQERENVEGYTTPTQTSRSRGSYCDGYQHQSIKNNKENQYLHKHHEKNDDDDDDDDDYDYDYDYDCNYDCEIRTVEDSHSEGIVNGKNNERRRLLQASSSSDSDLTKKTKSKKNTKYGAVN